MLRFILNRAHSFIVNSVQDLCIGSVKEFSVFKFPFRRTIDLYSGMQCGWVRVEAGTHATFNAEKHIYTHKAIIELDLSNRTLKS